MVRRQPLSTRANTLFPYTTRCRAPARPGDGLGGLRRRRSAVRLPRARGPARRHGAAPSAPAPHPRRPAPHGPDAAGHALGGRPADQHLRGLLDRVLAGRGFLLPLLRRPGLPAPARPPRSEEQTSEPQSLMRLLFAVFC